jgi:hypothetical protein
VNYVQQTRFGAHAGAFHADGMFSRGSFTRNNLIDPAHFGEDPVHR